MQEPDKMYKIITESDVMDGGGVVPGFLSKLWKLVDDEQTDELIGWCEDGASFQVTDPNALAKDVLPYYFKHNNFASFVRQLNMYGFKKLSNAEQGGLRCDREDMVFQHPFFMKDHKQLLPLIKRKVTLKKDIPVSVMLDPSSSVSVKQGSGTDLSALLQEVNLMKQKQAQVNAKLLTMKRENEELWQEVAELRVKHNNQQTIVQRLIQFLITMASAQQRYSPKRKLPLMMINSGEESPTKLPKFSRQKSFSDSTVSASMDVLEDLAFITTDDPNSTLRETSRITDVTDVSRSRSPDVSTLYTVTSPDSYVPEEIFDTTDLSPDVGNLLQPEVPSPQIDIMNTVLDTPRPHVTSSGDDVITLSPSANQKKRTAGNDQSLPAADEQITTLEGMSDPTLLKRSMSTDVDGLQRELDSLRDMLATGQFTLDATTLNGLFCPNMPMMSQEDNMMRTFASTPGTTTKSNGSITGNELTRYTEPYPDLLSFVDGAEDYDHTSDLYASDDVINALLEETGKTSDDVD